ncbi:PLP-dependent aminotransferase family protein [Paenibacillus luteus]|uniref:MocR-like pyridoxine biosynthesis transcription factor PdxR n=1 Tax=Paenibacillus luteus TaxID=2545753 RepID=UPI001144DF04|nr:PLP-dependent aminotransferase family protein [Paenibacillus luteus]
MFIYIALEPYMAQYSTKYEMLYHALKNTIVQGKLANGVRLPSSRELARMYGFSRGTVSNVLEALTAEGYVTAVVGSGTFVNFQSASAPVLPPIKKKVRLSEWGERLRTPTIKEWEAANPTQSPKTSYHASKVDTWSTKRNGTVSFQLGITEMSPFSKEAWNRCLHEEARSMSEKATVDAHQPLGVMALREAIAKHLQRNRGIGANAEQIVIVNGSMQAIALLTQLLTGPGDAVVAECPGYRGIKTAVLASGAKLIEGEVDNQGLIPQSWDARMLFVTPNRQYPTGAVLSMERRQQLLSWAAKQSAFIIEDEYDSEFRHRGKPIETFKSLDKSTELVIYTGTFSKTMMTDIRLGFVVLPTVLVEPFTSAKSLYEPHPSAILEQRALAAFMSSGLYERHLRRMKRIYSHKFSLLRDMLKRMPVPIRWIDGDAGLHIFGWWLGTKEQYETYEKDCREAGVEWVRERTSHDKIGISLGFSHLQDEDLILGIGRMIEVWERMS